MKLLLLEDDTALSNILIDFLEESYEVVHTYSMKKALSLSEENRFDIYIFDINLPDGDGISLLRELRAFNDETPTIFITAFHSVKYLQSAFESGANDFIRKPFDLEELAQRIENIKKYCISFDISKHLLLTPNKEINLSHKEKECLHYLYKNRHRVISSDELLQKFWSLEEMPSDDTIRTIIKKLRKYIGKEHIVNIRGEGYRFE